jgi:hypothetical protein
MTETLLGVSPPPSKEPADPPSAEELAAARELVRQARAQGLALTGPGGLLKALTKTVIETALEEEIAEHLGYDCEDGACRSEAGLTRAKTGRSALCLICRPASGRHCRLFAQACLNRGLVGRSHHHSPDRSLLFGAGPLIGSTGRKLWCKEIVEVRIRGRWSSVSTPIRRSMWRR